MRELIENLTELFGFGKNNYRLKTGPQKGQLAKPRTKFVRAVDKLTAKAAVKNKTKQPYLAKHGGEHLAARSRLAGMKMKARRSKMESLLGILDEVKGPARTAPSTTIGAKRAKAWTKHYRRGGKASSTVKGAEGFVKAKRQMLPMSPAIARRGK